MTTTSTTRTTTRIGLFALALAFGASSMSPAFARGGESGGGAGANPMQIAQAQNIANPPKAKLKKASIKRSWKTCGGVVEAGTGCQSMVSSR
jgi:osmotically-inducible protein OsmY